MCTVSKSSLVGTNVLRVEYHKHSGEDIKKMYFSFYILFLAGSGRQVSQNVLHTDYTVYYTYYYYKTSFVIGHKANCMLLSRRFASSEEQWDVPEWFLDDERKHRKKPVPVTKEMVEEYKQKWKEIDARPIKRVAEAKARKKRRVRSWKSTVVQLLMTDDLNKKLKLPKR